MIYGRFPGQSKQEVRASPRYPFIEFNGRSYQITELHETALGCNYQAEECDPREAASHAARMLTEAPGVGTGGAETPSAPFEATIAAPPFLEWARSHGWKGIGRIPSAVREAYESDFGAAPD